MGYRQRRMPGYPVSRRGKKNEIKRQLFSRFRCRHVWGLWLRGCAHVRGISYIRTATPTPRQRQLKLPANINLVPSGLGLRPEQTCVLVSVLFSFISCTLSSFLFISSFPLFSIFFRVYVRIYHGYVPVMIWLQVIRDGVPQLVSTVPSRTGTAVHVLFGFLPTRLFQ